MALEEATPVEGLQQVNWTEVDSLSLGLTPDDKQVIISVIVGDQHLGCYADADITRNIANSLLELADISERAVRADDCEKGEGNE